ncbi:MAG: tautomerase family protein [Candidatus Coatesbacteria bacterium]|nr:MAG: tautomerase family protein [Candidatus Coatesbacteria bacterium]
MPIITVDGPQIDDVEAKRRFVETLTDAMAEVYPRIDREHFVVIMRENRPENVASGGVLISDKRREEE